MRYLLVTYQWRILTRPQVAAFDCPVTRIPNKSNKCGYILNLSIAADNAFENVFYRFSHQTWSGAGKGHEPFAHCIKR